MHETDGPLEALEKPAAYDSTRRARADSFFGALHAEREGRGAEQADPTEGARALDGREPPSGEVAEAEDTRFNRPGGYRAGVREQVWGDAREESTGQVRDPLTGRFMSADKPWDMGHKPGYEFRKHAEDARRRDITREQFLDEHNDPSHYRPELPSSNRSHKGESESDEFGV